MKDALKTDRLTLRRWIESDLEPFACLNADPRVMEFMPRCLTRLESDQLVDRLEQHFAAHGFGLYAVELHATRTFAGFIGLSIPSFDAPFMPAVEIGWRIASEHWGKGLASEGAHEVVRQAFQTLRIEHLVSFTTHHNRRSIRVMEKLGMTHDSSSNFEHPNIEPGQWLRPHVLYRLSRTEWAENHPDSHSVTSFQRNL